MEHPEGPGNEGAARGNAVHDGSSGRFSDNVVRMGPSENRRNVGGVETMLQHCDGDARAAGVLLVAVISRCTGY